MLDVSGLSCLASPGQPAGQPWLLLCSALLASCIRGAAGILAFASRPICSNGLFHVLGSPAITCTL